MDSAEQSMDVYHGVRWSAVAQYGAQSVEVAVSIVVARIIAPEAYGLLGMAMAITGFMAIFQSLGFGTAIIQRKKINQSLLSSIFFIHLAISGLIFAVLVCGSPLFSSCYHDPRVGPIIAVLSITVLLSAPGMVPSVLLQRQMNFRRLAWIDIAVSSVRGISVISLALAGWGVWALVWSSIAGVVVRTPLLFMGIEWRPRWLFSWTEIRSVLGFGVNLTGFSVFNYFTRNADNLLIGIFLGAAPLGYYSLAYRILLFPRDAITGVLLRVLLPAFSRMQDDDSRMKTAYLRVCRAIAFLTFPMMVGITVVAPSLVEVVLGEKWLPAVPLLIVLAPLGALQSVWVTIGQIFVSRGRADWYFRWSVGGSIVLVASFVAGLPWGILGVAVAYTLVCVPWCVFSFWLAFRLIRGLSLSDLAGQLFPSFWMSITMGTLVFGLNSILASSSLPHALSLVVSIGMGIAVYAVLTLLVQPPAFKDFMRILPKLSFRWQVSQKISRTN